MKYERYECDNLFNLVFGDMTTGGRLDVNAVSDNGDRNKILATIGLHLEELSLTYEIFARMESQDQFIKFQKNMESSAFVIRRKAR